MNCPECGSIVSDKLRFCPNCGLEIPRDAAGRPCPTCGARVGWHVNVCPECGAPFGQPEGKARTPARAAADEEFMKRWQAFSKSPSNERALVRRVPAIMPPRSASDGSQAMMEDGTTRARQAGEPFGAGSNESFRMGSADETARNRPGGDPFRRGTQDDVPRNRPGGDPFRSEPADPFRRGMQDDAPRNRQAGEPFRSEPGDPYRRGTQDDAPRARPGDPFRTGPADPFRMGSSDEAVRNRPGGEPFRTGPADPFRRGTQDEAPRARPGEPFRGEPDDALRNRPGGEPFRTGPGDPFRRGAQDDALRNPPGGEPLRGEPGDLFRRGTQDDAPRNRPGGEPFRTGPADPFRRGTQDEAPRARQAGEPLRGEPSDAFRMRPPDDVMRARQAGEPLRGEPNDPFRRGAPGARQAGEPLRGEPNDPFRMRPPDDVMRGRQAGEPFRDEMSDADIAARMRSEVPRIEPEDDEPRIFKVGEIVREDPPRTRPQVPMRSTMDLSTLRPEGRAARAASARSGQGRWTNLLTLAGLFMVVVLGSAVLFDLGGVRAIFVPSRPTESAVAPLPTATSLLGPTDAAPAETPATTPAPGAELKHAVSRNESLGSIAEKYNVSIAALAEANGLGQNDPLRVGQELVIPTQPQPTAQPAVHAVQSGETLAGIAQQYGVTIAELREANGMSEADVLQAGQELKIPGKEATSPPPDPTAAPETEPTAASTEPTAASTEPTAANTSFAFAAPELLQPVDGAVEEGTEVLLNWTAVGLLEKDTWYVVKIWRDDGTTSAPSTGWTQSTAWRLTAKDRPAADATSRRFKWSVTVMRGREGASGPELLSPESAVRSFEWK